jgi:hypothetical protein
MFRYLKKDISRSHGCKKYHMPGSKPRKERKRKDIVRDGTLDASVGACIGVLGTLCEDLSQLAPSDEPMFQFLHAPDDCQRRRSEDKDVG